MSVHSISVASPMRSQSPPDLQSETATRISKPLSNTSELFLIEAVRVNSLSPSCICLRFRTRSRNSTSDGAILDQRNLWRSADFSRSICCLASVAFSRSSDPRLLIATATIRAAMQSATIPTNIRNGRKGGEREHEHKDGHQTDEHMHCSEASVSSRFHSS
jgi:hypothetical protein